MSIARILQIIGIIIVLDALYFGIARDSMKMEVLLLFIGGMVFMWDAILIEKGNSLTTCIYYGYDFSSIISAVKM